MPISVRAIAKTAFGVGVMILSARSSIGRQPVQAPPNVPILCTGFKVEQVVSRIAFGSCCHQDKPAPIWESIADAKPDLFIFLGDNIYGDTEDMDVLRAKYTKLQSQPGLRRLIGRGCSILATWDDHDFGENDAGADYPKKRESKEVFLEAFGEPADSPRRQHEGIYDATIIGPAGRHVQIILLDTRTFRSPLAKKTDPPQPGDGSPGPYQTVYDQEATLLGAEQWAWLAEQLKQLAELRIIASSIQFVSAAHGWEGWGLFPHERERMIRLLDVPNPKRAVFLSGDRHSAEISAWRQAEKSLSVEQGRFDGPILKPRCAIYEVTSSALNQSRDYSNEVNIHRIGTVYFEPNFGVIEIDWGRTPPSISLQIRDVDGRTVIRSDVQLDPPCLPITAP